MNDTLHGDFAMHVLRLIYKHVISKNSRTGLSTVLKNQMKPISSSLTERVVCLLHSALEHACYEYLLIVSSAET